MSDLHFSHPGKYICVSNGRSVENPTPTPHIDTSAINGTEIADGIIDIYNHKNIHVFFTLEESLAMAEKNDDDEEFIVILCSIIVLISSVIEFTSIFI